MKRWILLLFAAAACLAASVCPVSASDTASAGYSITEYDMDVAVHENNVYTVTETIGVLFQDGPVAQHGIYRNIPVVTTLKRTIGDRQVNKTHYALITDLEISDMELGDVAYESRRAGNDLEIKIGDPDVAVSGEHTYVIKYKYDVGADNITEFDDVYFNLLGKWDAVINHFQFTVRMPKPFDRNNVTLYTGDAQNTDIEYHVVGNTVTGSSRTALHDEDVTIRILLDEGYFVGARQLSNTYVYAAVVVVCLLTVCSALLWLFFGRDDKVFPKAIYYPPPGITPADAGYILKGSVSDADMSALVLYWADKGYLDVQQMEDGTMRFSKRREADAGMQGYEQRIFNKMFEDREDVSPMVLQFSTAQTVQAAKKELTDGFTKNPFRRIFTRKSRVVQALSCLFSGCCIGVFAGVAAYTRTYSVTNFVLFGLLTMAVYFGLAMITCSVVNRLPRHGNANYVIASFSVNMVIAVFAGFIMIGMSNLILPVLVGVVGAMLCNIFAAYGLKRTEQGNRWLEELLGFKEYIRTLEPPRLGQMLEKDGDYFFNILPYAYVLGVSEEWIALFDETVVQKPQWYDAGMGPFDGAAFKTMYDSLLYRQIFGVYLVNQAYAGAQQQDHTGGGSFGEFGGGMSAGSAGVSYTLQLV